MKRTIIFLFLLQAFTLSAREAAQPKPLSFIENKGQIVDQHGKHRSDIDFKAEGDGVVMFVGDAQLHYQWYRDNAKGKSENAKEDDIPLAPFKGGMLASPFEGNNAKSPSGDLGVEVYRLDVELIGANKNAELVTEDKQEYTENYYLPQCPDGATAHSYSRVIYKNVYPNIDWVIYTPQPPKGGALSSQGNTPTPSGGGREGVKYDFIVHPGGDYRDIQIRYNGATKIELQDGALVANTPFGSISENAPYTYDADTKKEITSKFVLNGNILSYNIVSHPGDGRGVVIDPAIALNWASYYGGAADESDSNYSIGGSGFPMAENLKPDVATDLAGNIYLAGGTKSNSNIATMGSYQTSLSGSWDGFAVKFNRAGQRLWATYYGGSSYDGFCAVAADASGNIYLGGNTRGGSGLASAGAYQTTLRGNYGGLLVRLNTAGVRQWATYIAGNDSDLLYSICLDGQGNLYAGGFAVSDSFLATPGAYDVIKDSGTNTSSDGWLAKFSTGGNMQWCTYYGGYGEDMIRTLACDAAGNVYAGGSSSNYLAPNSILGTSGTYQPINNISHRCGLIVKFNGAGQRLWCSYYYDADFLNNASDFYVTSLTCDNSGSLYVGGWSDHGAYSTSTLYTSGAYLGGTVISAAGMLAKFNAANGTRIWGTLLPPGVAPYSLACDPAGNVYFGSNILYYASQNIAAGGAYQSSFGGGSWDGCMMVFSSSGSLLYGTYYGGTGNLDKVTGLSLDNYHGNVILCGYTNSTTGIASSGSYQSTYGGGVSDDFIVSFGTDTLVYIGQPFTDTLFCGGDSVHINYGTSSKFRNGNTFTLQLSDAAGSFTSPVSIGTRTDTIGGIIHGKLPVNTAGGTGYRMRIVSSLPARASFNDSINIHIKAVNPGHSATSNSPICATDTLKLYGGTTGTGVSWNWSGPAAYSNATQNPIRLNATTGYSGNYILTSTYNGCTVTDTAVVVVKPLPAKPTAGSNAPLCTGANLSLTAGSSTTGVSWSWTGPNSYSSSSQNPGIGGVTTADAGNYIVTATLNGCSTKDTETVIVYPVTPKPTAGNNSPLCVSNTLSLTASTVSGASYSWGGPAAFTAAAQNAARSNMQLNMAGKYYVTATVNGCVSDADTTIVTVNPGPTINVYPNPNDTVCTGNTVTLVALVTNGGTGPSYQWYKNNNPIAGATLQSCTTTPANGDVYYCKFTPGAGTGCNGAINSSSITITVLPYTTPSISITAAPDTNIWQGLMVNFTATVSNCNNPTYQWKLNGNDVSGATGSTWGAATLADNNLVSCVLTCNDFCPNPKNPESNKLRMHVSTGVGNINNTLSTVNIYPNPMHDELHIEGISKGTRIQLYDVLGREVYRTVSTETTHIISTALLHTGTYILQLTDASGNRGSYKIVRE